MWHAFVLAERTALQRYGVALCLALASLAAVGALQALEQARFSSLALATVVLSAVYGGLGPALLDTAITAFGIDLLFSQPRYVVFDSWVSAIHIVVHGLIGALTASIVASLREAYRDADAARRARENVLAVVSHDLRSPLAAILLCAELLERTSEPALQEAARGVQRSGLQMRRLIDDLLDAVRIEKGQFRLEIGEHRLADIIDDAVLGARGAAEAKGVVVAVVLEEAGLRLPCDRSRLTQALANLLTNAVKFSPAGGRVEVQAAADASTLSIAVEDHGPGIGEHDLPHIFTRWWQGPATAHGGTGLGLFIAKSIVEAHGGSIEVASHPGRGSRFALHLPRRNAPVSGERGL